MNGGAKFGGTFFVECYDKHGRKKWEDKAKNVVTDTGIKHMLDVVFAGGTQTNPWYTGLLATTDITDTDILGGISLATEFTGNRPAYVDVVSTKSVTNTAGKSTFTCDKDGTTVEGAILASSNSMKGTTGILLSGGVFSGGVKVTDSGDKLIVTYTFSGADDGV